MTRGSRTALLLALLPRLCSGGIFFDSLPDFAASATVRRQQERREAACSGADDTARLLPPLYTKLEKVFVFDWAGIELNGLGNVLPCFAAILATSVLNDRAVFSHRDATNCTATGQHACRFAPSAYFGGVGGFSWAWEEAEATVTAAFGLRGEPEHLFYLSGEGKEGFVEPATGLFVPGRLGLPAFLQHPAVARLPWVRLVLTTPSGTSGYTAWPPVQGAKNDSFYTLVRFEGADPSSHARLATLAAARGINLNCLRAAFFGTPTPRLQARLLPPLSRLDAARRGGGAVVGIHVRSGYSDYITRVHAKTHHGVHKGGDDASRWQRLDGIFPICPADGVCFKTPPDTEEVLRSSGASCAAAGHDAAVAALLAPVRDSLGPVGGIFSSLVRCALALAASLSVNASAAVLFGAGDLPPLNLLLQTHPLLKTHVVTGKGGLGHVSFNAVCQADSDSCASGPDPSGAWSRTAVDLFMLGVSDAAVRCGATTFFNAAELFGGGMLWSQPQRNLHKNLFPANGTRLVMHMDNAFGGTVADIIAELKAIGVEQT